LVLIWFINKLLNSSISISDDELSLALPFVSLVVIVLNFDRTWLAGCLARRKLLVLHDSIVWLDLVIVGYCYIFWRLIAYCENILFLLLIAWGIIFQLLLIIILVIIVTDEARCSFMRDNCLMGVGILFWVNIIEW
jgi:hypothetical protein